MAMYFNLIRRRERGIAIPGDQLRKVLFQVAKQQAGIAQICDLRSRLGAEVAELKLRDSVGELRLLLADGLLPPVAQHLPIQPLATGAQDEEWRQMLSVPKLDALQKRAQAISMHAPTSVAGSGQSGGIC